MEDKEKMMIANRIVEIENVLDTNDKNSTEFKKALEELELITAKLTLAEMLEVDEYIMSKEIFKKLKNDLT